MADGKNEGPQFETNALLQRQIKMSAAYKDDSIQLKRLETLMSILDVNRIGSMWTDFVEVMGGPNVDALLAIDEPLMERVWVSARRSGLEHPGRLEHLRAFVSRTQKLRKAHHEAFVAELLSAADDDDPEFEAVYAQAQQELNNLTLDPVASMITVSDAAELIKAAFPLNGKL